MVRAFWGSEKKTGISSNIAVAVAVALAALILIKDLKQHPLTLDDLPQQQFVCISISPARSALSLSLSLSVSCVCEWVWLSYRWYLFMCAHTTPRHGVDDFSFICRFSLFFFCFSLNPGTLSIKQLLEKKICVHVHSHLAGLVACWQFFILYLFLSSFFPASILFFHSFISVYFYVSVYDLESDQTDLRGCTLSLSAVAFVFFFLSFNFRVYVDLMPCP